MGEIDGATTAGLSGDWHDVNADPELPATAGASVEDVEDGEIEDGEVDEALAAAKVALSQQGKSRTPMPTKVEGIDSSWP